MNLNEIIENVDSNNEITNIDTPHQIPNVATIEWETTISINSSESEYLNVLHNIKHTVDIILILQDGVRVSNRTVQKKVILTSRKLLTYYKQIWTPLERTTAIEENVNFSSTRVFDKCIHRLIVYQHRGIRISYNKEISSLGEKFNIEYEIEYEPNIEYKVILRKERRLIKLFLKHRHEIQRVIMTRIDMFSCVMSKVQMWHCFNNKQNFIWAYKWNGIKSKILITNQKHNANDKALITYVWSDASNISNQMCTGTNIDHLINICCAVEIMPDRIIIIEAIGAMVNNDIYTTEPMANATFLKHLAILLKNKDVFIGDKPVTVQQFYNPPLPNKYNADCDGFIIIQDDLIIKWKIPTIDVKCITPNTFKVGTNIISLDFIGEPGKIYEITYKNEVLRQRNDRLAASSDHEYGVFLDSSKMLLNS